MIEKVLGKITHATFGFGGYQDCQFGFSVSLEGESTGCSDFKGFWGHEPLKGAKWDGGDRAGYWNDMLLELRDILEDANAYTVDQLVGKPVEIVYEDRMLKSWRILKEVL